MRWVLPLSVFAVLLSLGLSALGQVEEGEDLFINECAGCHGPQGQGSPWAPSIVDEGAAGADFMMRTGRMPLRHLEDPIERGPRLLTEEQIQAITGYVDTFGGPPIPEVAPEEGDIGEGAELYLVNCAACHGSTGVGGALVASRNAPPVNQASAQEIADAIRGGPGPMPAYPEEIIDQHQLDSVTRYVLSLTDPATPGGWSLGRWGPVAEGAAAWLIGLGGVIGVSMWIEGQTREPSL